MKYIDIMLNNRIEYFFEVMMLKTLVDLAKSDGEVIDLDGVDLTKVQRVRDCNIINTLDGSAMVNHSFELNNKIRPLPYCSVKQMESTVFEKDEYGYNMRTSANLFNQGMTLTVQKYTASAIAYLVYQDYLKIGESPFKDPDYRINFVIDSNGFAESKIEEFAYMANYSSFWMNRMFVFVEDRPNITKRLKQLMRSAYYVRNRVSNVITNKLVRLQKIPLGIPMYLSTFTGKTDNTFKEEQVCIYRGYDKKKQSVILDKFPLFFDTKASSEYALDAEGIENSDLRSEVGKDCSFRREYFSIYSLGVLGAYRDEERLLVPLPISETVPLVTYGEDTYYNILDKDNEVPYGDFIKYVLQDHHVEYNKEGFEHYYYSEGCEDLWA